MVQWDPEQYTRYAGERARPFHDLLARIGAATPRRVVDLGCGPGTQTAALAARWPSAVVEGIDSSPEMIERARALGAPVTFTVGDVRDWLPPDDVDVIVSNATLQWVPDHLDLLRSWAWRLPRGGWLAFQVPGNFDSPSHVLMRALAAEPRWSAALDGVLRHHDAVAAPSTYALVLLDSGLQVDVWETTYLHLLQGDDPVIDWLRGTGLRPVLGALPAGDAEEFVAELAARLRVAYPATPHGTVLPYRRIFAVAAKP